MALSSLSSSLISIFLTFLIVISHTQALKKGFTTDLIHRDFSPLSPTYNPSLTQFERLRNSVSRTNRFKTSVSTNDFQSTVKQGGGGYLMALSVGTPPVLQLGIADTGSDLIWMQCQPCLECYAQTLPIFNPRKSSSYKVESCDAKACDYLPSRTRSCSSKNTCNYLYGYGDQSTTKGDLATETLTFDAISTSGARSDGGVSFNNILFGCGHENQGTFSKASSGLIGLGGGELSLVTQLGDEIDGKFKYCLNTFNNEANVTSKISFGTDGIVEGPGVVSTPLKSGQSTTFYTLNLESISVGSKKRLAFTKKSTTNAIGENVDEGNIIIDSGTTLTYLPSDFFDELVTELENVIKGETVDDPQGLFKLCYSTNEGGSDLNIPKVTAHFEGGADLVLGITNTFVAVSETVVCLAMITNDSLQGDIAIYGNIAQTNFIVGYDVKEGKVSFKPKDCTKLS